MNARKKREISLFFGRASLATILPDTTLGLSKDDKHQLLGCYFFDTGSILVLSLNLNINFKNNITLIR